jgi:hypothetical protein
MSATIATAGQIVRLKRPARKSPAALRLEGSLAAVVTLAPVIPIFPTLAFPPQLCREDRKSKI